MPELCFVKSYVHVAVAPPERVPTPPPLLAGISKNLDEFEPVCHLRALTSALTIVEPPHAPFPVAPSFNPPHSSLLHMYAPGDEHLLDTRP